jgi:hypothetical protein
LKALFITNASVGAVVVDESARNEPLATATTTAAAAKKTKERPSVFGLPRYDCFVLWCSAIQPVFGALQ